MSKIEIARLEIVKQFTQDEIRANRKQCEELCARWIAIIAWYDARIAELTNEPEKPI